MSSVVDHWTDAVAEKVREPLKASGLPLPPKRVLIHQVTDALDEDAWRLVLVLPAPTGETWDRLDVFKARRAAVDIFDEIATQNQRSVPGSTIALVTTDEASESDTAPRESPGAGEGKTR